MRTAILLVLLALLGGNASAAWTRINENERGVMYIDTASVSRIGDLAKIVVVDDLKAAQPVSDGREIRSNKLQNEIDCKERKIRILASTRHTGNMGEGAVVESYLNPNSWMPMGTSATMENMYKAACQ